mmetsp:Transcript_19576/g.50565  ORF Transcript_19576/g.50565 Transcript_19576/m.50565 type:complete len:175 (-) Transcript_19576:200-724(-)|eukprot:CAMPEP_0119407816 /NCGR_PEP_ID=MMETSP1335-20130426/1582_1 /TAXON_ID=259385 /ORGANISM="Chrysoculter rhomboideus, Strain RCC1486" /LENGTH=174 /DNA_ID=CAMNT_0007431973 /DNA_START=64 /DNA_END=588 /DNA_ORIENTATION=-
MSEFGALGQLFAQSEAIHREAPTAHTPADIGPKAAPATKPVRSDPNAIWDEDDIGEDDPLDADDGRAVAKYDLVYKQRVSPQDMFLGIDPTRNESTASCEDIVLRIHLPETKSTDINLDVKRNKLVLQAPKHKLRLYLPKPVDEEHGAAKWHADKGFLEVTLPVVEDWDEKFGS